MARIEPIAPAQAPDDVREALDRLPPLNIFRTLAHAETAFRPFLRFGAAVLGKMALDPVVRELAILTVAKEAEAEYEWIQHVAIGKAVGVSDQQIAALAEADSCAPEGADERIRRAAEASRDGSSAGEASGVGEASQDAYPFNAAQQAAIELAAAVVRGPHISDDLYDCVRAQFSDRELVELLIAIGDYLMLARIMTVLEIDLDEAGGDAVLHGLRNRPADGA
jgi:alkylhydroperoxidase family enzyme